MSAADTENLSAAFLLRKNVYSFLDAVFRKEPDTDGFNGIKNMLPRLDVYGKTYGSKEFKAGFMEMYPYFSKGEGYSVKELETEFPRIFYGIDKPCAVYPYESVYLSAERLLMQEPRDRVMEFYADYKTAVTGDFKEPEDHISCELSFMAFMHGNIAAYIDSGDAADIYRYAEGAGIFLASHLSRWVGMLSADLNKSGCGFYAGAGRMLDEFIREDGGFLAEFLEFLKE